MDNQNNYYPQQPQYIDPQAYTPAPPIPDQPQPAAPAEPEVILQEVGFADYGFGEGDSVTTGHDFGNIMDDDNTEPAEDDFNIFNSQTPNFDPAAVEAASKTNLDAEKAIFTATTPNFDPASVAAASSAGSASDREIFSGSFAVGQMQQTVSETPTFDAATAALDREEAQIPKTEINPAPPAFEAAPAAPVIPASDFLASMQGMFASMNGTAPAVPAAPAAPAPAPAEPAAPVAPAIAAEPVIPAAPAAPVAPAEPVIPAAPAAPVAPPPAPVPVFENDLVPDELMPGANKVKEEPEFDLVPDEFLAAETAAPAPAAPVQPAQPDMVANAPVYSTIQDISSTAAPVPEQEKGADYWNNIDQMLGNFEQKPAAPAEPAAPAQNPVTPPPINEEKGGFPFSGGAQATDARPAAPVINTIATTSVPAATAAVAAPAEAESDEEIEEDFIASAREKRAAKKAERDAKKAAKKAAAEEAKAEPAAPAAEPQDFSDAPSGFKGILYRIFPNRNDSVGGIIRKCVSVLAAIALIVCAVYFLHAFISSKSQAKDAKKLADIMASSENSAAAWEDIYKKYPNINFPSGMQAKFADLYAMNQDLIGWIRIPGLGIDYPVVQAQDDNYYLKRDFRKQSSAYGTVFLSSKNQYKEELDLNTVIYGHAMRRDKQMFSRLHDYKDSSTFVQNPIIEFNTLFANYKFKVYCVFLTNGSSAQDNGYLFDYTFPNLASVESFAGFVAEANQRKLYSTGTDILPTDKIICLSTCSYEFDNARFVVVGRMLRAGESEEIDSSKVEANKNPRYPQAWYDSNKKTNPYASYSHWKPTY